MFSNSRKLHKNLFEYSHKYLPYSHFQKISFLKNKSIEEIDHFLISYILAFLVPTFFLVISLLIHPYFQNIYPFLFFLLVIPMSAAYGGIRPGIFATTLTTFYVFYYFIPPYNRFLFKGTETLIQMSIFFIEGIAISYIVEVTRKVTIIKEYRDREKEYARDLISLHEENKRLQKEIKARDEFLSVASHELKTPLTSMLLQLQSAIHSIRNVSLAQFSIENLMEMLENGEHQIKRLSRMINDLVNISVITTGQLELELKETDLVRISNHVINSFKERLKQTNVELTIEMDEKVEGKWDRVRMEQVLTNFFSNAIKYGNQKPILFKLTNNGSKAKIVIHDNGIGIKPADYNRIFELFTRAAPESEYKGMGVGLYISNQIVKAHHGTIKIHSNPDEGTTFTIELPKNPKSN